MRLGRAAKRLLTVVLPWYDVQSEEAEMRRIDAVVRASQHGRANAAREAYRLMDRRVFRRRATDRW